MEHFIVLSCLLAVTTGFVAYPGPFVYVDGRDVSSQESTAASDTEELYRLINETLVRATQGIRVQDLSQAAVAIAGQAQVVITERGANVSREEIEKLVNEAAAELRIETSVSNILEDPLTAEGKYVETALRLLHRLSRSAQQLQAAGEPIDVHVAAIQALANSLNGSVVKTAGFVRLVAGGPGTRGQRDNVVSKRQWTLGLSGYYGGGGWGLGGSVSYTFGRR